MGFSPSDEPLTAWGPCSHIMREERGLMVSEKLKMTQSGNGSS